MGGSTHLQNAGGVVLPEVDGGRKGGFFFMWALSCDPLLLCVIAPILGRDTCCRWLERDDGPWLVELETRLFS